jgi:hypothetical protein
MHAHSINITHTYVWCGGQQQQPCGVLNQSGIKEESVKGFLIYSFFIQGDFRPHDARVRENATRCFFPHAHNRNLGSKRNLWLD